MVRVIVCALLLGTIAIASPVPPESDSAKVARLWGKVHAPSRHYTTKPEGSLLTLRTIGWPVDFGHNTPTFQVTREVVGDFDARVKVYDVSSPSRGLPYWDTPQTAAGLYVDGGNCGVGLYRWKAIHKADGILHDYMQDSVWLSHKLPNSSGGSCLEQWEPGKSRYLRIVRKGQKLTVSASPDGKQWNDWDANWDELKLPPVVTVGIFVGHTTSQEVEASFERFTVEQLK